MIFLTVLQQVIVLLILIALGVILAKIGIFTETGVKNMTDMVLLFVTPCVIIRSFIREFDPETLRAILLSFLAALAVHLLFIAASHLVWRCPDEARRRVLRFGSIFTNCGYMSLPLQEAVLGDEGVLYGASFVAIFNMIIWSYGVVQMSGDRKYISPRKLILNPGVIGIAVGLIIFLPSLPVPEVIAAPIGYMAALNTPLPMMIIGYHLAQSNLLAALRDRQCMLAVAFRLIALPVLAIGILYLCGMRGALFVSVAISACAPTAAITTMFSSKFGQATELSVNMVSLSTVFSLITIPLLVALAQYIG